MTVVPTLEWTGERMVPHASDPATELYHWQRYLFFRPWYEDAKVIDAASGEGYGTHYASVYGTSATGIDIDAGSVEHASKRYPNAQFQAADVCEFDYSGADLVLSFETIEHLPDPVKFLKALSTCQGKIVISTPNRKTHSPGNTLGSKPLNPYHTIEWTPNEFADVIRENFPGRQVRFLSQEGRWPGLIKEGLDDDAMYCIAVVGDGELPKWPRLGLAMPTHNNSQLASEAIFGLGRFYPGEIEFALVDNGSEPQHVQGLRQLRDAMPYMLHLIEEPENRGYAVGCNTGLNYLWQESRFDFFGVVNDDVVPAHACLSEMAYAINQLQELGHKPGVIGPVSNNVNGKQQVDIGPYNNATEMMYQAEQYHLRHHSGATQVIQVRGLFLLINPDLLSEIGGFDPRFGIGNFEDDDFNLRTRLAGFSSWIADGAFLYHHGSTTFKKLQVDYNGNILRNSELLRDKWGLVQVEDWITMDEKPEPVELFVPLTSKRQPEFEVRINGEVIDLINQASDMEFAAWVMHTLSGHRDARRTVLDALIASAA